MTADLHTVHSVASDGKRSLHVTASPVLCMLSASCLLPHGRSHQLRVYLLDHHFAAVFSGEFMPIELLDGLIGGAPHYRYFTRAAANWLARRRLLYRLLPSGRKHDCGHGPRFTRPNAFFATSRLDCFGQ